MRRRASHFGGSLGLALARNGPRTQSEELQSSLLRLVPNPQNLGPLWNQCNLASEQARLQQEQKCGYFPMNPWPAMNGPLRTCARKLAATHCFIIKLMHLKPYPYFTHTFFLLCVMACVHDWPPCQPPCQPGTLPQSSRTETSPKSACQLNSPISGSQPHQPSYTATAGPWWNPLPCNR